MKMLLILLLSFPLFAATVINGSFNRDDQKIELEIEYSGGCAVHSFHLELEKECLGHFPTQCSAYLKEKTQDQCDARVHTSIELDAPATKEPIYLTVFGDNASSTSFLIMD